MDEMLELNFNLRTVQRLGYSIGVIFTVEICKGEPKNLHTQIDTHVRTQTYMLYVEVILIYVFIFPHRNWFIPVDHPSGTTPYMQGAMQTPFRKVYPPFTFSFPWLIFYNWFDLS